jgi:CDP-diacylglycerol--serine O-phosphatidyltransferase
MNTESDPLDLESNNRNEDTTSSSSTKNLLEEYRPIDDHVELVSEGGQKVPRKGIYLLPNLFTSAALFAGFFAIISAINLQFVAAGLAIFFGQLLDGVDGRVARLTKTQSKFGQEFDSLSDMVTFGIAPAIIIFMWCLSDIGKVGWAVGFIYVASAAIRLARFNAQVGYADDRYFSGLASPPAATLLASSVWLAYDSGYSPADLPTLMVYSMMFLTIFIGLLMVVNVPYYSFKNINLSGRVSLVALLIFIFLLVLIASNPPKVLFILALTYAFSGPFYLAIKKIKG